MHKTARVVVHACVSGLWNKRCPPPLSHSPFEPLPLVEVQSLQLSVAWAVPSALLPCQPSASDQSGVAPVPSSTSLPSKANRSTEPQSLLPLLIHADQLAFTCAPLRFTTG